jgi:hypothetical protein
LGAVGGFAEDEADGRVLVRELDLLVQGSAVELRFADVLGLELADLQLDGEQALRTPLTPGPSPRSTGARGVRLLKEQQVDAERVVADGDRKLLANERQVAAELEEEIA